MYKLLRFMFYHVFIKTIIWFVLGLNVRHRERLPVKGPAIIVANHNSHLDALVLVTLLSSKLLPLIKPVAAMDYFMRNKWIAWFSINIIGIIPLSRTIEKGRKTDPLAGCSQAVENGEILILFPEGSRGKPEEMTHFKSGVARLAQKHPSVPFIPVYMHGFGKALPRGEALLVPFFCDIFVGHPVKATKDRQAFIAHLEQTLNDLSLEEHIAKWD